jgi:hypothetical protein
LPGQVRGVVSPPGQPPEEPGPLVGRDDRFGQAEREVQAGGYVVPAGPEEPGQGGNRRVPVRVDVQVLGRPPAVHDPELFVRRSGGPAVGVGGHAVGVGGHAVGVGSHAVGLRRITGVDGFDDPLGDPDLLPRTGLVGTEVHPVDPGRRVVVGHVGRRVGAIRLTVGGPRGTSVPGSCHQVLASRPPVRYPRD